MNMKEIRWYQRFYNYQRALKRLIDNIAYVQEHDSISEFSESSIQKIPDIMKQGIVQSFEFTHELAWNVIKDYAYYQGNNEIRGSRDAVRYAAQVNLVSDGHIWMEMISGRNRTSHVYDETVVNDIVMNIVTMYLDAFLSFEKTMEKLKE
ncbi:nucleotidyltransferase substrate binding protein [Capnocytophaga sp.]|uniref:nucleotidyltransferase substrate binding protein n=1 Tax=Capnocytophaga sp. TaxID=44737 RepID=UPI0026DC1AB3|nr:nucleotidyltransferase substrate binding protein [Capnocytophaga sp.]MDO5105543.1 nucleotidyltransferase substrate binding protein [Capnocytophaga sp.]